MNVTLDTAVLAAFVAFCRVGGCFLMMPGLSSVRIPVMVRLFVAVAATFALLLHMWDQIVPAVDRRPAVLLPMIASELLIGVLIGLLTRVYILALQFIASAIAMMIGYGGMLGGAVEDSEPQAPLASIISFSALLLLFVFDFHHEIVRALVNSYKVAPVSGIFNVQTALVDLTDGLSEAFFIMLRLGSPFLAYAIIVNLAIGFINKLTPQIPVYFISLPFVLAGGLLIMYLAIPVMLGLIADGFVEATLSR
ncbi:MAG: flagellar biosynthetic protein FliR [Rhizobiaceae bacterium]